MLDRFDPRDDDRRSRDDVGRNVSRGSRGVTDERAPASTDDPRDVFLRDIDLPRDHARERVRGRDRIHDINGDESRLLSTVGAFRVVPVEDLRHLVERDRGSHAADIEIRHLRAGGLVQTIPLDTRERDVVVLTKEGRNLLEVRRHDREPGTRQTFYAGLRKPRELTHDAQVYRAFSEAHASIRERGGHVRRVVLDYELKREYQRFLQARNRGRGDSDGRPDREPEEIAEWARQHDLPYFDDHVHFPDARVEYEDRDGRDRHEDLEVVTPHYRGAHAAGTARSGFRCYCVGMGLSGSTGRGGRAPDPRLAEEFY